MNMRDKAILYDLERFRVLDRDHIIALHFSDQKQPIAACNRVMNRLKLQGHIKADTSTRPYRYFPEVSQMKKNSSKIPHFLSIASFYVDLCKVKRPDMFEVEAKLTEKGGPEPDILMYWMGKYFFVEIQRSRYTAKKMQSKMNRYDKYQMSGNYTDFFNKFPLVWIVSDAPYNVKSNVKVVQSKDVYDFVNKYDKREKTIKYSIG